MILEDAESSVEKVKELKDEGKIKFIQNIK